LVYEAFLNLSEDLLGLLHGCCTYRAPHISAVPFYDRYTFPHFDVAHHSDECMSLSVLIFKASAEALLHSLHPAWDSSEGP
jgi:hypothetical protein